MLTIENRESTTSYVLRLAAKMSHFAVTAKLSISSSLSNATLGAQSLFGVASTLHNWFMVRVRLSSYGCAREVA